VAEMTQLNKFKELHGRFSSLETRMTQPNEISSENFLDFGTVPFLSLFDKYYLIVD